MGAAASELNERNELFRPDERLPGVGRVDQKAIRRRSPKGVNDATDLQI